MGGWVGLEETLVRRGGQVSRQILFSLPFNLGSQPGRAYPGSIPASALGPLPWGTGLEGEAS